MFLVSSDGIGRTVVALNPLSSSSSSLAPLLLTAVRLRMDAPLRYLPPTHPTLPTLTTHSKVKEKLSCPRLDEKFGSFTCLYLVLEGVSAVYDQLVEGQGLLGDGQVDHRPQLLRLEKGKLLHFYFNTHKNQISLTSHFTLYQFWLKFADFHSTFWRLKKLHRGKTWRLTFLSYANRALARCEKKIGARGGGGCWLVVQTISKCMFLYQKTIGFVEKT